MKFTLVVALLVSAVAAMPAAADNANAEVEVAGDSLQAMNCGSGLCRGIQDSSLCNNRCQNCSGPSGPYSRGECGGFLWQTCRCFY
ncbi:hypothetical protein SODALDRAFT_334625 [Sodiomyces alkalinus F11]|uniref:Invertebrate defensins family profile domain-containing protein n=1 Tax=Sodiomyces alkalinus (strain CBS 110278 / VKM F-3762 / F11) TaxID=1314773 RepID=A0A3N2PSX0_SODAK|nr:hypothetical protein SODALDRAFT_334625 [Sodiomyces alkalinus F11]ROT37514.1 hypothetical protein SODALDRAFT_334625 [Sodiomyces alkalinus F11]